MPPLEEGDSLPESSIQVIDPHLVVTTRFNIDQATCTIRLYIDIPEFRWRLEKSPRHEGMLLDDQQRRLLGSWTQQDWNLLKDSGQGSAPPPSSLRPGQSPKSPAPEPAPEPMRPSLSPVPLAITVRDRRGIANGRKRATTRLRQCRGDVLRHHRLHRVLRPALAAGSCRRLDVRDRNPKRKRGRLGEEVVAAFAWPRGGQLDSIRSHGRSPREQSIRHHSEAMFCSALERFMELCFRLNESL